jgi:phosphoesterase RecJ-like protein
MIPGVEASVLLREEPGRIAVNLRSKGRIDVSAVARNFGGGGHSRAAGFKRAGGVLAAVKKQILAALKKETAKLK